VGEFCKSGLQWMSPGVYLDCSIGGSRKNQRYVYTVFALREDGATVAYNDDAIVVEGPRWRLGGPPVAGHRARARRGRRD